jgi:branched-subunit amino acid aminotransferase/4-amino-4-deoxychorismate lyase
MQRLYNLNGTLIPAAEASLPVNDLAIIRGFGIFDFFLVWDHIPLFLDDYLDRFFRSAELLNMEIPTSKERFRQQVLEVIEVNKAPMAGIRLVMTGGSSPDSYTPVEPNVIIMHHDYKPFPDSVYTNGIKLLTQEFQRDLPEVKTTNYANGIRLIPKLKAAGATEPLYHDKGYVKEAVRSNFYIVKEDGTIVTAEADILFGITRKHLLRVAEKSFKVEVRPLALDEVWAAKEAFITGSNKGVMPVTRIDDHQFGDGKPGPVTKQLMADFDAYRQQYVEEQKAILAEI